MFKDLNLAQVVKIGGSRSRYQVQMENIAKHYRLPQPIISIFAFSFARLIFSFSASQVSTLYILERETGKASFVVQRLTCSIHTHLMKRGSCFDHRYHRLFLIDGHL